MSELKHSELLLVSKLTNCVAWIIAYPITGFKKLNSQRMDKILSKYVNWRLKMISGQYNCTNLVTFLGYCSKVMKLIL